MEFLYTYETLKLEFPLVEPEKARFILLGVPFDGTTSYKAGGTLRADPNKAGNPEP